VTSAAQKFSHCGEVLIERMTRAHVTYLVVGVLLAAFAGLEIHHALSTEAAREPLMCMAPQSKLEAMREMLLLYVHTH
jgi:FixJ family two-component response regulator